MTGDRNVDDGVEDDLRRRVDDHDRQLEIVRRYLRRLVRIVDRLDRHQRPEGDGALDLEDTPTRDDRRWLEGRDRRQP